MNIIIKQTSYILVIFFFISCTKEISYDKDLTKPILVLNSYVVPNEIFSVKLEKSIPVIGKIKEIIISGAMVSLYADDKKLEDLKFDIASGRYVSTVEAKEGIKYTVTAKYSGYIDIEATTIIPKAVNVIIEPRYNKRIGFRLMFKDIKDVSNYYRLVVFNKKKDGVGVYNEEQEYYKKIVKNGFQYFYLNVKTDDPIIIGKGEENTFMIFNDELIDGVSYNLKFGLNSFYKEINKVSIVLQSLSYDHYMFLKTLSAQLNMGENPFTEPIQIYSNVKGGAGIFSAYNIYEKEIELLGF